MPTYEYVCESCGHQWEAVQSMKDDPLKDCPKCVEPKAKRQISAGTGFILKGGGWYADGYGSGRGTSVRSEATKTTEADPSSYPTKKSDSSSSGSSSGGSSSSSSGSSGGSSD